MVFDTLTFIILVKVKESPLFISNVENLAASLNVTVLKF